MLLASLDIRRDDYDYPLAVQMIGLWRKAAEIFLHGDYYPLTPFSKSAGQWVARQIEIPEEHRGLVQALRLKDCPAESFTAYPMVTAPGADYVFENPETSQSTKIAGAELAAKGFSFTLPKRSAGIWFYRICL